jgi:hypothetical protein
MGRRVVLTELGPDDTALRASSGKLVASASNCSIRYCGKPFEFGAVRVGLLRSGQ